MSLQTQPPDRMLLDIGYHFIRILAEENNDGQEYPSKQKHLVPDKRLLPHPHEQPSKMSLVSENRSPNQYFQEEDKYR